MIVKIPLYRFRASLADAVEKARRGSVVILTRHGKPIAEVRAARQGVEDWEGVNILPAKSQKRTRPRAFKGPGTMSRQILAERRRNG